MILPISYYSFSMAPRKFKNISVVHIYCLKYFYLDYATLTIAPVCRSWEEATDRRVPLGFLGQSVPWASLLAVKYKGDRWGDFSMLRRMVVNQINTQLPLPWDAHLLGHQTFIKIKEPEAGGILGLFTCKMKRKQTTLLHFGRQLSDSQTYQLIFHVGEETGGNPEGYWPGSEKGKDLFSVSSAVAYLKIHHTLSLQGTHLLWMKRTSKNSYISYVI